MPTPTYTALANITLGSSSSSLTFSSIPNTYRDLVLAINLVGSGGSGFYIQFNTDTGNNYNYNYALGNGSTPSADVQSNIDSIRMGNLTTDVGTHLVNIMDYSATDKHKTVLVRSGAASGTGTVGTWMIANRWASTSAITSIKVFPLGATMNSGATLSLYGIAS
jgi:hypothetical protein